MTYLLAKYTLLFLIASILGFALGYWWSRRRIVDVTESYESLSRAGERNDLDDWQTLWARLDALPQPKETDLSGINVELRDLKTAVASIPTPHDPDFSSVNSELGSLKQSIAAMPSPEKPRDVDLSSIEYKLAAIEERLASLPRPQTISFAEINTRLDRIDEKLKPRRTPELAAEPPRQGQPVILSAALYGDADNLKRISGVGPKLEKLLHKNGVYYFWQVASWSNDDIEFIDNRLDVFKGRIARDNWVRQAEGLKHEPGASRMPGN